MRSALSLVMVLFLIGCASQRTQDSFIDDSAETKSTFSATYRQPDPFIYVSRQKSSETIKAINPSIAIVEEVYGYLAEQSKSEMYAVDAEVNSAVLELGSNGEFALVTRFNVGIVERLSGKVKLTDSCLVRDGDFNSIAYFEDKFAINLNKHLEIHAKRCAEKNISTFSSELALLSLNKENRSEVTLSAKQESKPKAEQQPQPVMKTSPKGKSDVPFIQREEAYLVMGVYISLWDHKNNLDDVESEYEFDLMSSEARYRIGEMKSQSTSYFIEALFDFPVKPIGYSDGQEFYYGVGLSGGLAYHPTGDKLKGISMSSGYRQHFGDIDAERSNGAVIGEVKVFSNIYQNYGLALFARADHHFAKGDIQAARGINYGLAFEIAY